MSGSVPGMACKDEIVGSRASEALPDSNAAAASSGAILLSSLDRLRQQNWVGIVLLLARLDTRRVAGLPLLFDDCRNDLSELADLIGAAQSFGDTEKIEANHLRSGTFAAV